METLSDRLDEAACWDLLARCPHGNLAGATPDGTPVLRTLHHAILGGALWFHGAPRGEKLELAGRPAVFGCEEVVARIPSYWLDPDRACPATTYFRSVQARGTLVRVEDADEKARALAALMGRLQPEGGHVPIEAARPEYRGALRGLLVLRLDVERLTGRWKLGQNRSPEALGAVLAGLWRRGGAGDLEAMEAILAGNPRARRPAFLRGPGGVEFLVHPDPDVRGQAAELLGPQYWNRDHDLAALAEAQLQATAWVGARDSESGRLVATAAALSNRVKHAWVYDVAIDSTWRGRGLGTALLRTLLDHPALRRVPLVSLRTRDAHGFYRRVGFVDATEAGNPSGSSTMLLRRRRRGGVHPEASVG